MRPMSDYRQFPQDGLVDVSDADLAVAERRLRELPSEEVVPLRPEWIESVVAAAGSTRAAESPPLPIGPRPTLPWLRRWGAAAVALFGIQGFAAAMTVTGVGVVTAAVFIWNGQNSTKTLSFDEAVQRLLREDHDELRDSAMKQVVMAGSAVIHALLMISEESGDPALVAAARDGLATIADLVDGKAVPPIAAVKDTFLASLMVLGDRGRDGATRQFHLARCLDCMAIGIAAIHTMPACSETSAANRTIWLTRLRQAASR